MLAEGAVELTLRVERLSEPGRLNLDLRPALTAWGVSASTRNANRPLQMGVCRSVVGVAQPDSHQVHRPASAGHRARRLKVAP